MNCFAKACLLVLCTGESKLDILINNAGISFVQCGTTCDGYETNLAVNHLGEL